MSRMVEVIIDSVRVSLTNQQRIIVLRQVDDERYLPIWIGPYEAEAITVALQNIEVSRPQTHDLLMNVISRMGGRLVRVEVVALRDDVFYGSLVVDFNDALVSIDCRPSDALALAVRARVPVLVAQDVMRNAGVAPEVDMQNAEPASTADEPLKDTEESKGRLSVFEDFLSNLDLDDLPPEADEANDDSEPEA